VTELRNRHSGGEASTGNVCRVKTFSFGINIIFLGINVKRGCISDMWEEHVVQPLLVNTSEIALATECVGMILKIDDLIAVR
jgi:chaperonin GroEL (HSP60 family)